MVLRLVLTLVTLNGVIALILLYFTEFDSFAGLLRHSGCRWTYIVYRTSSSTFGQNWPTLQRGLCDSQATCSHVSIF